MHVMQDSDVQYYLMTITPGTHPTLLIPKQSRHDGLNLCRPLPFCKPLKGNFHSHCYQFLSIDNDYHFVPKYLQEVTVEYPGFKQAHFRFECHSLPY